MLTIFTFATLTKAMASITSGLADLAYQYKENAPRTELDEAHIDILVAQAQQLIAAAEALKSVEYDPTSDDSGTP